MMQINKQNLYVYREKTLKTNTAYFLRFLAACLDVLYSVTVILSTPSSSLPEQNSFK
jgi:hypothetical protein